MTLVDVHVHLAALPTAENGCLISRRMLKSPLARFLAWRLGLPLRDPARANALYLERLTQELSRSAYVRKAVLLAMDGAYDAAGRLDESRTDFLISNDAVFKAAAASTPFFPGVSINPRRRDALDELERCAARGARLVKVLPNAQGFDPAHRGYLSFYRALARLKLPLLCHTGYEFSLAGRDQSLGDPKRLRPALEEGVAVIAAHGCSEGLFFVERHLPTMLELARCYSNFFVDTSALTLPNRALALPRFRRHPEIFDRLIFGTDYPLPCFAYPCLAAPSIGGYLRARSADNRFDRQWLVLHALGIEHGKDASTLLSL